MTIFSYSLRYGDCLRGITIASFVSSKREIGSDACCDTFGYRKQIYPLHS